MSYKFSRFFTILVGLPYTISLMSVLLNTSVIAQNTPLYNQNYPNITADGNLNEYSPTTAPFLVRGTVTPAVKDVQLVLKKLGFYNGVADSIYDYRTFSSVTSFQKSRNLVADGKVGPRTWEALIQADNSTSSTTVSNSPNTLPVLRIGSRGQAVRELQEFLKQRGYYDGVVDGYYNAATSLAVQAFQELYPNLRDDGIVGPRTWEVIKNNQ